jgi:hypothetical protein
MLHLQNLFTIAAIIVGLLLGWSIAYLNFYEQIESTNVDLRGTYREKQSHTKVVITGYTPHKVKVNIQGKTWNARVKGSKICFENGDYLVYQTEVRSDQSKSGSGVRFYILTGKMGTKFRRFSSKEVFEYEGSDDWPYQLVW